MTIALTRHTSLKNGMARCSFCDAIQFRQDKNLATILDKDGNRHLVTGIVMRTFCHKCNRELETDLTK